MDKREFWEVLKPWLRYWKEPDPSEFELKEWYDSLGGWLPFRLENAFRTWKTAGKRWPQVKDLLDMDRKARAGDVKRKSQNDKALRETWEMAEAMLRERLGLEKPDLSGMTASFRLEPIIDEAIRLADGFQTISGQKPNLSAIYGTLNTLIHREMGKII